MRRISDVAGTMVLCLVLAPTARPQSDAARDYKRQVVDDVEAMKKQTQVMNDMVFSFGELGFQEFETSKYLTEILEKEGFAVERGIAGIPTAWMATWGSGKPVIALGSDIDCIPKASQKPGVARHEPTGRGRARTRRGSQLGPAPEHHRRDRGQTAHGASQAAGHDQALAGRGGRAARDQGLPRARRAASRMWTSSSSRTSATTSASRGGRATRPAWCPSSTPSRARARTRAPRPGGAAAHSMRWS